MRNRTFYEKAGIFVGIPFLVISTQAAVITTVDSTGVFDENTNAPNAIDIEIGGTSLAAFKSTITSAYAGNLGGVIDWESGVAPVASSSSPGHTLTSVTTDYGVSPGNSLTVTFDQEMALYTNNIANQVSVLSQGSVSNTSNALTTFNVNSVAYTMSFSGVGVTELGAAIPSRSTYDVEGVNFRATATFSGSGTEVVNYLMSGTPGAGDTFLHFAAPSGETIDSLAIAWVDDNGGSNANGQRRPILDDIGFVVIPEPSLSGLLGLGAALAFARRRR